MVYIVPAAPGTGPIDWSLRATRIGEICTPFAHYVRIEPICCSLAAFPAFARLPTELQIHVLRFCSSATLFQLMQTSAMLRHEASKLFWSDPGAWYHVDGSWLSAGGYLGDAYYAADFLYQVRQIEVNFEDLRDLPIPNTSSSAELGEEPCAKQKERICDFWHVVQYRFPRVVRVVVSESIPRRPRVLLPNIVKRMVQGCPSSISASVSAITTVTHGTKRATRYRARLCNTDGQWEVTDSVWVRQSILLPPKAWRGPVGEYAQVGYQLDRYMEMKYATHLLLMEAIERSHSGEQARPFRCPGLRCEVLIERGGQWALHAVETGHNIYAEAPEPYKEAFAQRKRMVKSGFEEKVYGVVERLREQYKMAGNQQQEEIRQAFLDQLESDAEYAVSKSVRESVTWMRYLVSVCGEAPPSGY